ncbi:MAG TPA: hypothetical protein VGL81_27855 [Polyangiaceae bacterium]
MQPARALGRVTLAVTLMTVGTAARADLGADATAAIEIAENLSLFARADVATLLAAGSQGGATDTTWLALWLGVEPRLF